MKAGSVKVALLRLWPYILLFCAAFFFFLLFMYGEARLKFFLAELRVNLEKNGIDISEVEKRYFPPQLTIAHLEWAVGGDHITLENLLLQPRLFPPGCYIRGNVFGGQLGLRMKMKFMPMSISALTLEARGLSLKAVPMPWDRQTLQATGGKLDFSGKLVPATTASSFQTGHIRGQVKWRLQSAELAQSLPLVTENAIKDINGSGSILLERDNAKIETFSLESEKIQCQMGGDIKQVARGLMANLDLLAKLRFARGVLVEEFLPQDIRSRLEKDGYLGLHISGTIANPAFALK